MEFSLPPGNERLKMDRAKPVVAIVGRPNVGKSALFNRLSGKRLSLVHDRPGVTRDRVHAECRWSGHSLVLVDTGGVGLDDRSGFEEAIEREVSIAIGTASDILLVVDGREGLNVLDEEIAARLRKAGPRVYLAVNKLDSSAQTDWEGEFHSLGFSAVYAVSAAHGLGIAKLKAALLEHWPRNVKTEADNKRPVNVAIVGRPNAGKSSLVNALVDEERIIVSPIAGTTRDAIDVAFKWMGRSYCLIDTAGMRRRTRLKDSLERAMSSRAVHAIDRADICVLVIDAVLGAATQEKKIVDLVTQAQKPYFIAVNKWDLAAKSLETGPGSRKSLTAFRREYVTALRKSLFFATHAPVVFISALNRDHVGIWLKALALVEKSLATQIGTGELNRILGRAIKRNPPPIRSKRGLKLYYAAHVREEGSAGRMMVFINDRHLWTPDYARYLEQHIRRVWPLPGCPLRWEVRDKSARARSRESDV
jgi:GTP-binding protein